MLRKARSFQRTGWGARLSIGAGVLFALGLAAPCAFAQSPVVADTLQLNLPVLSAPSDAEAPEASPLIPPPPPALETQAPAAPTLALKEGPLSLSPQISAGKLGGPDTAFQTALPEAEKPQLNFGGSASVQMQENMALSLDYMAGRSGSAGESAPLTGLAHDPASEQKLDVNMKFHF